MAAPDPYNAGPPKEGGAGISVSSEDYAGFLRRKAPERVCHVCGRSSFRVMTSGDDAAVFNVALDGAALEVLGHYCKNCGTVTLTAAAMVTEEDGDG